MSGQGAARERAAPGRGLRFRRGPALLAALSAAPLAGACALTEVTVAESDDVVIVESQLTVMLEHDGDTSLEVYAYLHRTLSAERPDEVDGAAVLVSGASGATVRLEAADSGAVCLAQMDEELARNLVPDIGSCYRASVAPSPFSPREVVELAVTLPGGSVLSGVSRIPDAFDFVGLIHEAGRCRLEPSTNYRFRWTQAAGTWSYLSDARIVGLPEALAGRDVEAPDTLYLTGFGIGKNDTDIVFPGQYGLFDLGEQAGPDLLRILDEGLPDGAAAKVAFAANDRNWMNWARGGNFNPSGIIRIPSVFGEGTGFFGTATQREMYVAASVDSGETPPLCGPATLR